jgi:GAF domain-containing protein
MSNDRVEKVTDALGRQKTIRGVLETACHGLVDTLDATACEISRVVGDLLVGLVELSPDGERRLDLGHEYLISEYPLTQEVIERGEARTVSLLEEAPEPNEARLLEKLGFESLLMVCLPTANGCWGLVEAYADEKLFDESDAAAAEKIAAVAGEQLDRLDPASRR